MPTITIGDPAWEIHRLLKLGKPHLTQIAINHRLSLPVSAKMAENGSVDSSH